MIRRLRLASGLLLFTFVSTHLINHMLGLVSLEALESGRLLFLKLWRNVPATILLYAALIVHIALAYWALYQRRSLKMPISEAVRLVFGFSIPILLVSHIIGTRFRYEVLGFEDSYTWNLLLFFEIAPMAGLEQLAVVILAWVHGCIGVHFWLRSKPWYAERQSWVLITAVLVPVVSMLGVWSAGQAVLRLAADPQWRETAWTSLKVAERASDTLAPKAADVLLLIYLVLLAVTIAARIVRSWWYRRHGILTVLYPNGKRVPIVRGSSVLEASRNAGIPHAAICGGRGRCSTCRVRIGTHEGDLPAPSADEIRVLGRIHADQDVRLACQLRPQGNVQVTPLLAPSVSMKEAYRNIGYRHGDEREIAVLFADLRDFTSLSENRLPYDVVYLLNRYFAAMGTAVQDSGGRVDKFIGDGVMALFGVERGVESGCQSALEAARRMALHLEELNNALSHDLSAPLRIGIGIHAGPVIVGEMGFDRATSLTAIGDVVNTASRLEALTKEFHCQLVVSEPVVRWSGLDFAKQDWTEIELRGRAGRLSICPIPRASELPGFTKAS